ncbi:LacI family DNA-binding transcriptional regulator [Nioella aestuarii]|uniref:LacI family DNA-binding transcriptional regulator n=1 Tax=Nioella aestuarii TaxID=1662864 RepID=UPI003D7FA6FC
MAKRSTVKDVAREAGVSVSTVDRALNGRMKVREETLRKIAEAAHKVGYHARGLIEHRMAPDRPKMRLGFVLLKPSQAFYQLFSKEIEKAVAARTDIEGQAVIRYAKSQAPEEFASLMESLGRRVDALACVAVNHQSLNRVVQDLQAKGVPVFSLLNDFAQGIRRYYVGSNNVKVGRVAAWMISRSVKQPGKLALFVGGNRWHGHDLREVGFRSFIRENAPALPVLDTLVNLETRELTYEATLDLLTRHPDLRGIFIAGGGMEGAFAALREMRQPHEVALVVNELTDDSRAALADGYAVMAIATPLDTLCTDLIELMVHAVQSSEDTVVGQHFLQSRIYLPEMI